MDNHWLIGNRIFQQGWYVRPNPEGQIFKNCKAKKMTNLKRMAEKLNIQSKIRLSKTCNCWFRLHMRICVVALNCFPVFQTSFVRNKMNARRCCYIGLKILLIYDVLKGLDMKGGLMRPNTI